MDMQQYLTKMARTGVSGYFLLYEDGQPILHHSLGLANRLSGIPNTAQTLFDIASIAKTFTAAAILRLHEEAKVELNAPLGQYFDGVPLDKKDITVHQLLTHTSGLTRYISDSDFEQLSREEAIRRALQEPLRAEPGSKEQYGEANYMLLAVIVEKVSGAAYTDYIRASFLHPLRLVRTCWYGAVLSDDVPVATGYISEEAQGTPREWPLTWSVIGAGGMLSTPEEMGHWLRAMGPEGILSENSRRLLMLRPLRKWAGGWEVHDRDFGQLVLKGGSSEFGFSGVIAQVPEQRLAAVLLLNARPEGNEGVHHEMIGSLLQLYFSER